MKCSNCKYYTINEDKEMESNKCELTKWFYFSPYEEKDCIFVNDDYSTNDEIIRRFA